MADYTPFPLSPWYERPSVVMPLRSHKLMAAGPNGSGGVASELLSVEQIYSLLSASDIKPFADPATKRSSKAISYTATVDDNGKIIAFTATGLTLTLPRASFAIAAADGFGFLVSAQVGTLTITRSNTDTILGVTSITLNQGETAFLFPDAAGTGWRAAINPTYNTVARLDVANVFTQRQHWAKGTNIASAVSIALPTNGNFFDITGTATITAISTVTQAGTRLLLRATGAWTLQHNATSMILPSATNITLAVGDIVEMVSLGSGNYLLASINKADGKALVVGDGGLKNGAKVTPSGVALLYTGIPSGVAKFTVHLRNVIFSAAAAKTLRVGPSTGIVSAGYEGSVSVIQNSDGYSSIGISNSVPLDNDVIGLTINGSITFTRVPGTFNWEFTGQVANIVSGAVRTISVQGGIALAAELDRFQVSSAAGTATMSGTAIWADWEFSA
ncbi:hypothetical protein [Agrobacterium rosae]|uniref:hypothetical protein n=1 Tax=Agrobacterium rosae TaxID=1972867 RepID=UPI003BA1B746